MGLSVDTTVALGVGGLIAGALVYVLINKPQFPVIDGGTEPDDGTGCKQIGLCTTGFAWSDTECKCVASADIDTKTLRLFYKNKKQCVDGHITQEWLIQQGIRVVVYNLYNDGKFYVQQCSMPSPLFYLVAVNKTDLLSPRKLQLLGFTEYLPPAPLIGATIPPPTTTAALAMVPAGMQFNTGAMHKAYLGTRRRRY